jgi:hypothetical protein
MLKTIAVILLLTVLVPSFGQDTSTPSVKPTTNAVPFTCSESYCPTGNVCNAEISTSKFEIINY